jgi:hypothetical protein
MNNHTYNYVLDTTVSGPWTGVDEYKQANFVFTLIGDIVLVRVPELVSPLFGCPAIITATDPAPTIFRPADSQTAAHIIIVNNNIDGPGMLKIDHITGLITIETDSGNFTGGITGVLYSQTVPYSLKPNPYPQ